MTSGAGSILNSMLAEHRRRSAAGSPMRKRLPEERETPIQKRILDALEMRGVWAFRVNSGSVPAQGGWYHGAPPGTPDICIVAPVPGWLEVKRKSGKRRKSQIVWHARAEREGVRVAVVRSAAEALRVVESWTD